MQSRMKNGATVLAANTFFCVAAVVTACFHRPDEACVRDETTSGATIVTTEEK
jgi:hypothetical protein